MRKSRKEPTIQPIHKGHYTVSNKRYMVVIGYFTSSRVAKKNWLGFTRYEKGPPVWNWLGCGYYNKKRSQLQALECFIKQMGKNGWLFYAYG